MIWHVLIGAAVGCIAGFTLACIWIAPTVNEIDGLRLALHRAEGERARIRAWVIDQQQIVQAIPLRSDGYDQLAGEKGLLADLLEFLNGKDRHND